MNPGSEPARRARQPVDWKQIAERGSIRGLRIVVLCYRLFGQWPTLALVHAVVTYFFLTDRSGRRASRAYLRRVQRCGAELGRGGRAPGFLESYRHYRSFAVAIADRLAIWFGDADHFDLQAQGTEVFDDMADDGTGAIILGAHLGSFDVMRVLSKRTGIPVNVLMFTENAETINTVFQELSPDAGARLIHADPESVNTVFTIRECIRRGEHVAILADRIEPGDRGRQRRVELLGSEVPLSEVPFLLAGLIGCPVAMMVGVREGTRRYRVVAEVLSDARRVPRTERQAYASTLLEAYAKQLEAHCIRTPYQWYNFFDYWGDAEASD